MLKLFVEYKKIYSYYVIFEESKVKWDDEQEINN